MTIPSLMAHYKAQKLRNQFLKSYSTVQQVFKQMEADEVSLNPDDYPARSFYIEFMKYLKGSTNCTWKHKLPCYLDNGASTTEFYKSFDGKQSVIHHWFDDGQILLPDGTLLLFENGSSGASTWVSVDLNNYSAPPNRWGYDLFTFEFADGELRTMGDEKSEYNDLSQYCNLNVSNTKNGIACAHKAKTDTDYFKNLKW